MSRIIGLDIGQNSIGWVVYDSSSNKIVDCGVRIMPISIKKESSLDKLKQSAKNKFSQLTLFIFQVRALIKRTNLIVLSLCIGSFATAMLIFINFSNWQFWFNSSLTISLAVLTLLYKDDKK